MIKCALIKVYSIARVQTLHLLDPSPYLAYYTAWSSEQSGTGCWKSSKDCKHSMALMEGPQQSRAIELLSMNRQQLSVVIGLLTGHLRLHGHLHKIGKDLNLLCRRCLNGSETVEHLLYELLIISQGRIFGQSFGEHQQLSHVPMDLF